MRELADEILVKPTGKNLEILDSFFEVAKTQNWVSPSNVLEIQKEYDNLKEELKQPLDVRPRKVGKLEETIPVRQQKILEILKEKGRAQVWELKQIFPEISKRTLRRDFGNLLNQGSIERIGERNETFYQIKEDRL
ncbi:unnamed protein product [marine sediment metagenome]|uniref:HTH deoR-type domain-containing protein n=1 Tax=marine sediment metagenome TaxID=412755 RepID=X1MUI5_9ZZZZ